MDIRPKRINSSVRDVVFGDSCIVIEPSNLYECTIGDGCFIGPFVEIQRGVSIGERTKIQSHSFICQMVDIGSDCFIGHGVMFVNDTFSTGGPANGDTNLWQATRIGNNVSIGSNASILPVYICDNSVIGAGAVVTKDVTIKGIYAGNPARLIRRL